MYAPVDVGFCFIACLKNVAVSLSVNFCVICRAYIEFLKDSTAEISEVGNRQQATTKVLTAVYMALKIR